MSIFHYGPIRFPGGHRVRDRHQPIFARRTNYKSRRPAARVFRALVFVLAFSLTFGFIGTGSAVAGETLGASSMDSVSIFGALESKVKKSNSFRGWDTLLKRYAKQEARLAKGRGRINEKAGAKLWNEMIDIGDNAIVEMVRVTQFDRLYSVTEADGWLHMKRA